MGSRFSFAPPVAIQRVRLRLSRLGEAAALTHLQQIDAIRRALRNSGWPVSVSQGKKPVMKISFGPAISVGVESTAELCDVQLASRIDLKKAPADLDAHLPAGYRAIEVKSIPRFFPSLEESINLLRAEVSSPLLEPCLDKWKQFEAASAFPVVKKKGDRDVVMDARPLVKSWALNGQTLELQLRFGPGRTIKPERLAQAVCGLPEEAFAVGTPTSQVNVKRLEFFFEKNTGELIPV